MERNPLTPPPMQETFNEWLRYLVQSSRPDAPELEFIAGLYSYCVKFDGLTPRQAESLKPMIEQARNELRKRGLWSPNFGDIRMYEEGQSILDRWNPVPAEIPTGGNIVSIAERRAAKQYGGAL